MLMMDCIRNLYYQIPLFQELDTSSIPILAMGNNFLDPLILPSEIATTQASTIAINSAGLPRGVKRRQTADYRPHPFSRPMEVRFKYIIIYCPIYELWNK